jgi:uncharacterized membrane protein YcaP (DUF421 family)
MSIVIRATIIYFFLWIVARGTGKRELAQLTPFEFILVVIMGDLIQQGVTEDDRSLTGAVIAVATITFWVLLFSSLTYRSKRVGDAFDGVPVVVVRDGVPVEDALRYERISMEELAQEARMQGIADLRRVRVGVLEPSGSFSFLLHDGSGEQQHGDRRSPKLR